MSACRRSAACTGATIGASLRWPNTGSACPLAWTTAPLSSRNGTPCARSRSLSRPPRQSWETRTNRRRLYRTGDPPHRVCWTPRSKSALSRCRWTICWTRCASVAANGFRTLGDHADQAHGRGPDRIPARTGHQACATCTRDIDTLERIEILRDLRLGAFDVLIGINLLREGLDIPECGLVAILDADKEGFLRSETSLIQTIGRAARNADGRVSSCMPTSITGSDGARAEGNRAPSPIQTDRL